MTHLNMSSKVLLLKGRSWEKWNSRINTATTNKGMSQRLTKFATFLAVLMAIGIAFSAIAQTTTGENGTSTDPATLPSDPIDSLCKEIGRPIKVSEIRGYSGFQISGIKGPYTEVIGRFVKERARSVRYLPDQTKAAQFVTIEGRKLCLTSPQNGEVTCGVPIICSSGEADFVMVDENDAPFVLIKKPSVPDSNNSALPEDHNWVAFAGGTARISIEDSEIPRTVTTKVRNFSTRPCTIGAGHPLLDSAFAYKEGTGSCNSASNAGPGSVIYLSQDGSIGSIEFGYGRGVQNKNGRLYWSFPETPIDVSIECATKDDARIPRSAAEVAQINVQMAVSGNVVIGDPLIYSKLIGVGEKYIEKICGRRMILGGTKFQIVRNLGDSLPLFSSTLSMTGSWVPEQASLALKNVARSNEVVENYQNYAFFAQNIRQKLEADRMLVIRTALRSVERLPNLAEGIRSANVETLTALSAGLGTRMPWARINPSFNDGQFRISWTVSSSDPWVAFFEERRSNRKWSNLQASVPSGPRDVSLRLTCLLRASEADDLPVENFVDVVASLISYNSNEMILSCTAP